MVSRTLIRYFGMRFLGAVTSVFLGIFVLIVLVDYIELTRRAADIPNLSAWTVAKTSFFRVPALTERLLPFSVLVTKFRLVFDQPLGRWLPALFGRHTFMQAMNDEHSG